MHQHHTAVWTEHMMLRSWV